MRRPRVIRMFKHLRPGGGIQTRLLELLPRLAASADVRVLCYRERGGLADRLEAAGVPVDVIPLGVKWTPSNLARYVAYFRQHEPDVVHTHEYTANTLGVAAAARAGVPVRVRHLHTMVPWGWGGRLRTRLRILTDRRAAGRAQMTLAVSQAVRLHYLEGVGLPPETCRVLYNGVDLGRFVRCRERGRAFRAEFGIAATAPVAGVVGRLSRGKGHAEFLRTAQTVAARLPEARFLIVGDGGFRGALEARARELGLGERVVFTGFRSDVPAALGAMDVFLFSSGAEEGNRVQEGLGGVAIEAQAAGVPVVGFRLPMAEEVVEDGASGSLVALGDVDAMAEAAVGYLTDRSRAEAAGRLGRELSQRFSLDACAEATLGLYDELLGRAAGRPASGEAPSGDRP